MICPFCGQDDDQVIDSRSAESGTAIRRRRRCKHCDRRFTTYERVEKSRQLVVIKRDGSRDPFDAGKVLAGLRAACGKRPIPEDRKLEIVERVEEELHRDFEREVPSLEIGRRVAIALREVDDIAYIRYASEYYAFRSLRDLLVEAEGLATRPRAGRDQGELF